ncbi:MAG: hypothetical protein HYY44_09300 [Deltaproteobacteria bacterium]|nr:hypothetical protein [Deltaproteobacteria bacterium]MBI4374718.1 hypothetical protein [Deltaproteobacteria bacterium]
MPKDPMEELWEVVSQEDKDGQRSIIYQNQYDLLYLYANGFVDFKKYTLDQWIKAFDDSKEKDGSYKITKDQWLKKAEYRYNGPIGDPFDPDRLQEREFSEKEFEAVFKQFVCPSTWIPEANIPVILDYYRKQNKLVNGKIRINKMIKGEIRQALDRIPSPLRILQLDVASLRNKSRKGFPMPATAPQTGYVPGMNTQKLAAKGLEQLSRRSAPAAPAPSGPTVSLKDLAKKGKKSPSRA